MVTLNPPLSLEVGAQHLTQLLRSQATGEGLPGEVRSAWLTAAQTADLQQLFTEQRYREDWKYTPVEFFRQAWALDTPRAPQRSADIAERFILPEEVRGSATLLPAVASLPQPTSPWEAFLGAARYAQHYSMKEGAFLLAPSHGEGVLPLLITISVAAGGSVELLLTPQSKGLLVLRVHLHLAPGAQVRLYLPTDTQVSGTYLYMLLSAHVEREARFESYDLTAHAAWKRTEQKVRLSGPGAEAHLYGAARVQPNTLWDQAIRIEHAAPHTHSNQLFKSLVHARARSTFQGRIYVHREAQKTNAYQSHKALLWDATAAAYSRPQLEIFADDVRCTHGVTTGFLQGDMLLYLQARGVPEAQAREMLAGAFLAEVLDRVPQTGIQEHLRHQLGLPE